MKKILLVLGVACITQFTFAQKSVNNDLPERLFKQGKEMYNDKNYVGCQNSLGEFKRLTTDQRAVVEADYLIVTSYFHMGNTDAGNLMKDYLDTHPETYHRNQLCYYIGSTHFDKKEWNLALYWLMQADVDYLPQTEQDDFMFRMAYANLQGGDIEVARQSFGLLSQNSRKYNESATFYLAYIDFKKGNYDRAINVFEQYKSKPEYQEEAAFFLVQGEFLKNNLRKAISDGEAYATRYPHNKNAVEVYRILGNSYNRTGDTQKSITNYEKYLTLQKDPLREDMYLLGNSYVKTGNYEKAVTTLQKVASTTDKLGQAAYLQLGQSYLALNDNNNALMAFDAAAREKYDNSISEVALYNYAVLAHKTSISVFDQSVTVLERFLNEYPKSSYVKNINSLLASTFMSTSNYNAALNAINKLKSPDSQILAAKQSVLFKMGTDHFINSDYNAAINSFSQSINMGNYDAVAKRQAQYWRGETYYRMGNYSSAATDFGAYVASAPQSDKNYATALYGQGYSYFQLKDYSKAQSSFLKYVEVEKRRASDTYPDALNRLGDCYLYARNFSAADRYYSLASANGSTGADYADFQKAFVLGLQQNNTGKVAALDAMLRKYPNSEYRHDAMLEKAGTQVLLNRNADAITTLNSILSGNPRPELAQEAGMLLGQTYYNSNNNARAIDAYKKVVAVNPNTESGRLAIQSLEGLYKENNDIGTYINYVNSLGSGVVISTSRQDSLIYASAEDLLLKGQNNRAKTAFESYLQSYPNGAFAGDAHFNLGSIAYDANDKTTALAEYTKTINSNNSRYLNEALELAAKLQFDNKEFQTAYNLYDQLNDLTSDKDVKQTAQIGMLRCGFALDQYKEVIASANAVLSGTKLSAETEIEARFFRGKAYLAQNQTDKALEDFLVVGKETRSVYGAESQYLIANIYHTKQQYKKAEESIFGFMKMGTSHEYWMARALILMSDNYLAMGDNFQAKQYLESLKSNYKNPSADITEMINSRLSVLN